MRVKQGEESDWMNASDFARIYRLTPLTVIKLIDAGEIEALDVSQPGSRRRSFRIHRDEVERFRIRHRSRVNTGARRSA